jgi:hypothetical protein
LKNYNFCSGQQNEIWACGFSWLTGPVGLWSEKFFVKTAIPNIGKFLRAGKQVFSSSLFSRDIVN